MNIRMLRFLEGARSATGLTVIIDVFRAFSVACYLAGNGAEKILAVARLEDAYLFKGLYPNSLLVGERNGRKAPGFDYGNSPFEIQQVDFTGKTIIHTTSAGTQGLNAAEMADEVITGSFVNAQAIVNYVTGRRPAEVSLVAMGWNGQIPALEDDLCAGYLRDTLLGRPTDFFSIKDRLRKCEAAVKFFDPACDWAPEDDFDLCLSLNRFDFVLTTRQLEGTPGLWLKKST
ncbi:MAG: 2-phosphosulfolactate phosphatase [Deltaproteobacteria bacterium]|nr:2-phosphosulfolactate phosphatase [Deltaproteobacteria bacterium]